MGLTLTVLGCCGSYPGPGEACSGYLVRDGATTVWMDAGSGTLANLQKHTHVREVDAIVLSHEHPDHWIDMTGFYVAAKYYFGLPRVPVYAPESVRQHAYYHDSPIDWHVVTDGDERDIGSLRFRFSRTDHGPETLAMRVDGGGRSMVYTADTGPGWSPATLGEGVDLLLSEATYLREHEGKAQHLSARQAGMLAAEAKAERLVLTHLQPGTPPDASGAEAGDTFGRDVEIAKTNQEYEL